MTRNRDPKTIRGQLAWAERGLNQLEKSTDADELRARLGRILYDLIAVEKALAREGGPPADQVWLDLLMRRAEEAQGKIEPRSTGPAEPSRPPGRTRREPDPVVVFWMSRKLGARAAAGLSGAGIRSLDDLKRYSVERLLAIPGIGLEEVRRCEALLGRALSSRADYWTSRGLPGRTAGFLVRAGVESLEDLARMTRAGFLLHRGLGERALRQCEALLGRPLPWPEDDWREAGCQRPRLARKLAQAGILTVEELRGKKEAELVAAGLTRREIEQCGRIVRKAKWKAERA